MSSKCRDDNECGKYNYCDLDEQKCIHDDLFKNLGIEIICIILIGVLLGLHNIAGLGVGTVKIYVLMLILNYSMDQAIPFTYPVLLGSKIADNIFLFMKKHPIFKEYPLINYNVVMIFLPATLLGSYIGTGFAPVIPYIIQSIIQVIFLITASFMTSIKVRQMYRDYKENRKQKQKQQEQINQKQEKIQNCSLKLDKQKYNDFQIQSQNLNYNQSEIDKISCFVTKSDIQYNNNQDLRNVSVSMQIINQQKEGKQPELLQKIQNNKNDQYQFIKGEIQLEKQLQKSREDKQNNIIIWENNQQKQNINDTINDNMEDYIKEIKNDNTNVNNKNINKNKNNIKIDNENNGKQLNILYQKLVKTEKKAPKKKFISIFGLVLLMFLYYYIQGGKGSQSPIGIKRCSVWYWFMYGFQFVIYGIFFVYVVRLVTGIIGFGGANAIVPTIALLGLHPRAATASTSFLTVLFGSITAFTSLIGGQISINNFLVMFCIGFVGSFIFSNIFNKIVERLRLEGFTIAVTVALQIAMLIGTIILWVRDLIKEPFSFQTETDPYC
ncbi:hypothetical protein PPERSA_00719 [Pseudocohnilembus persalinus]|uniref:Sulfite exporter TauE/SafE n=1 Tax=Pseudocohnilembus persalinus TaxID=266149 RepID=A0A0V0QQK2_PSEPJ|nr:hypothetical protein PPERSA_00719 [Pseudocohnilembus persalinus]|eukprot:KRX04407.1 hypothetical protein PPERSA_00719 [Pseudocohnilembus persalinus]